MSSQSLVCTGCSCLCDDLRAEVAGTSLCRIENACAKGTAYLRSAFDPKRRASSSIRGRPVSLDEALTEAARLLSRAKNQLVFGLESATLEAQAVAIELAHHIGGAIDGASSFSCGTIIQSLLSGDLPTVSLAEAKDKADLLIYWGSNPPHTHPRHLSRFTYYAYTDYDPAGWYPRVTLSCVEVRNTELSSMCRPAFKIKPGGQTPLHRHPWEHLVRVERGEGVVFSERGGKFKVTPSQSVFIPPGEEHQFLNPYSEVFEFICVIPNPEK